MGPPPRILVLVAVALPRITRASFLLNASALRSNATALGIELLLGPVPVPSANKSFWSIAYPENYYDPQCQKRPHTLIEDCECACNALGGTLACIENPEQNALVNENFPHLHALIGAYQRTAQNPYKGWRWTAAANPRSSYKDWGVWDDEEAEPNDGEDCAAEQCVVIERSKWLVKGGWVDIHCKRSYEGNWRPRCLCETGPLGPATSEHFLKHKDELRVSEGLDYCDHRDRIWIFLFCAIWFLPCALCLGGRNLCEAICRKCRRGKRVGPQPMDKRGDLEGGPLAATAAAEATNPLVRQLSETAFFAEPFPCEAPGCEKFHSNAHGHCDAHAKGSLGFAGLVYRKVVVKLTVVLVAVVMGLLETKSKYEAAIFCAASATVVQINLILEAGRDGDPLPCLYAVLFALLFGGVAWNIPRLLNDVEAVDELSHQFKATSDRHLDGVPPDALGPATVKRAAKQPIRQPAPMYCAARQGQSKLEALLTDVAGAARGTAEWEGSIKRVTRARRKVLLDYGGDWRRLRDVLRGRVVVDDAHDLGRCCDALQERVRVVSVKNRFRGTACGSGYRDLNIVAKDDDAFLFEVQIHLKDVLSLAEQQHRAYELAQELDALGALDEEEQTEGSRVPASYYTIHNAVRVPLLIYCAFMACLYLDTFTLAGAPIFVRRAKLLPPPGFHHQGAMLVVRLLGLALALPYGVIAYMVAGKMGLLGEAQRSARYKPSRLTLFYERRLGYLGSYFNYKIWLVQMFEVYIQCFGKVTKIHVVDSFFKHRSGEVWSVSTVLAIMINVAYPAIFLGAKTARLQRDLVFIFDTTLDAFYAILPIWLMLMGCREQSLILPHDPMTFCSNLVPLFHAHFVLSALEEARRVAKADRARLAAAPAPAEVPEADAPPEKKKCSCFRNVVFWGLTANVFIMSIFCLGSTWFALVYGLFNSHMGFLIYGCIIFAIPVALFAWLINFVSPGKTQADDIALRTKLGWRGRILFYAAAVAAFPR
jgi:hypothetical protein